MVLKVGIASHCLENYKDCKVYIKLVLLSSLNMSFENILVKYLLWKNTAILQKSRKDLKKKAASTLWVFRPQHKWQLLVLVCVLALSIHLLGVWSVFLSPCLGLHTHCYTLWFSLWHDASFQPEARYYFMPCVNFLHECLIYLHLEYAAGGNRTVLTGDIVGGKKLKDSSGSCIAPGYLHCESNL